MKWRLSPRSWTSGGALTDPEPPQNRGFSKGIRAFAGSLRGNKIWIGAGVGCWIIIIAVAAITFTTTDVETALSWFVVVALVLTGGMLALRIRLTNSGQAGSRAAPGEVLPPSGLVCPDCNAATLDITDKIEVGVDDRFDERALQLMRCSSCGTKAIGEYEETRHGAKERVHHRGYRIDAATTSRLRAVMAEGSTDTVSEAFRPYMDWAKQFEIKFRWKGG